MSLPDFRHGVQRDIDEAAGWYEDQRSGLGVVFALALCELLERIDAYPLQFPVYEG